MAKYRAHLDTTASLTITVLVPDNLDEDDAREMAIEEAIAEAPGLCHQCSGYGRKWNLDLGDWDVAKDGDGKEIQPEEED